MLFRSMREAATEKKNWMFLDPGDLKKNREANESAGIFGDKWKAKEDARPKSSWDIMLNGAGKSEEKEAAKIAEAARALSAQQQRTEEEDEEKLSKRFQGLSLGESEKAQGAHTSSELDLKSIFEVKPNGKGGELSLKDVFGASSDNAKEIGRAHV